MALVALAIGLLTIYSWFVPEPGPNELSRLDLVYALVRQHTTSIDAYAANTIDRALFDGRFYSDKPIGLSLFAAPVLFAGDHALGLGDLGQTRVSYVAHLLTVTVVSLPAALLGPLMALTARRLGAAWSGALISALAVALATALLPFAGVFYAHAASAALAFAAFAFASGALLPSRRVLAASVAGLCAGLAALVEYPVLLVAVAIVPLLLSRDTGGSPREDRPRMMSPRPSLMAYCAGVTIALSPLPIYNWLSFGAPWRLGYGFVDPLAFGGMSAGFFGLTLPRLDALQEITLSSAGLIVQSPFLLLAPFGLLRWRSRPAWCAAAIVALFLLYNASYYLPMGGQSSGPRFLVPALPFLAVLLAFAPRRVWLVGTPLALYGFVHLLAIAAVEPKTGPGHANALLEYWLPRMIAGDLALSWSELRWKLAGASALLPLVAPLLIVGASATLVARDKRRWAAAAVLAAALMQWVVLVAPFARGGVPERFRSTGVQPPSTTSIVYGASLELVGYRLPAEAAPGTVVDLDLYWRAPRWLDENLVAFVHAVGPDGENLGGRDLSPAGPGFPTNLWRPGEVVRTPFRLRLDDRADAPVAAGVIVGLYPPGGRALVARLPDGSEMAGGPSVARLALRRPRPGGATSPARASFEGGLELLDWRLPAAARAGAPAAGSLRWRARERPGRDAIVFVQALGRSGPIAQWDSQPRAGRYPTSLWPLGEIVDDEYSLTVPAAGDYPVIGGLYLLPELRRLTVEGGGDVVELGTLRVEP